MFLRKLTVMVAPLLLCAGLCLLLPLLGGMGFFTWMLGGLALVVLYQYLHVSGLANIPVLAMLATTQTIVILVECAFIGFMVATMIRTRG